jgi:H+-transporting ATPase
MPNAWRIGNLTVAGIIMGIGELMFCTSVVAFGAYRMGFDIGALRTLAFVVIVFGNQATMYTNRERRHMWSSRPSFGVIVSSIADLLIASTLAIGGIAMTPLPAWIVAGMHACRRGCLRCYLGFGEGSGFPPARNHLERVSRDHCRDSRYRALLFLMP